MAKGLTNGWITTWLDAQHRQEVIAQQARRLTAPHVVAAMAATGQTPTRPHPILRLATAGVAMAIVVVAGPAAVQGRAGRNQVRSYRTRPPKCSHSRQYAKPLRREQQHSLIYVTYSCATRGMTGREQQNNCTTCSKLLVSKSGLVKKILVSAFP